jgi:hypothetical protein
VIQRFAALIFAVASLQASAAPSPAKVAAPGFRWNLEVWNRVTNEMKTYMLAEPKSYPLNTSVGVCVLEIEPAKQTKGLRNQVANLICGDAHVVVTAIAVCIETLSANQSRQQVKIETLDEKDPRLDRLVLQCDPTSSVEPPT